MIFKEPVSRPRCLKLVVRQNLERQMEAPVEFVLPLLGKAAGTYNEAALQIAARNQFFHEQAGHDGFPGAGIIGQQESEGLTRKHGFVNGSDLMRQRIDDRGMDREHRVEEMREADALRFGN